MTSVKRQLNMDADDVMANGKETPKRAKRRMSSLDGVWGYACAMRLSIISLRECGWLGSK